MNESLYLEKILAELSEHAKQIDANELHLFSKFILSANRIFVAGAGRSGFIASAFSNRLMHLGFTVYFVGEPTTPSLQRNDLLIINSGSGSTESLLTMAEKTRKIGAKIALLTIFPASPIASLANVIVKVPGSTPKSELENSYTSFQPMGNLFEQFSWLIYDSIILSLKEELAISSEDMFARHANLE